MPGKRPAPKSAKGKKAPSRPAVRKAVGHKPEPVRVRAAPGHARKSAAAPKKPVAAPPAAGSAPPVELRKPLRVTPATPPPATATMITASRSAAHAVNADGDDGETIEPGEEIGIKRLEARPVATLSIEAQERRERRERQYGDRDDRYR